MLPSLVFHFIFIIFFHSPRALNSERRTIHQLISSSQDHQRHNHTCVRMVVVSGWVLCLWIIGFIGEGINGFLNAFYLLSFSDFEDDLIPALEMGRKLNFLFPIEAILQGFISLLFLISFRLFAFALTAPLACFSLYRYLDPNSHFYIDPTQLWRQCKTFKGDAMKKVIAYALIFFFCLYRMIMAIIFYLQGDDADDVDHGFFHAIFIAGL